MKNLTDEEIERLPEGAMIEILRAVKTPHTCAAMLLKLIEVKVICL